jgi:DNA-binding transcriptional LysR family regulator
MPDTKARSVPKKERHEKKPPLDWGHARIFLEVVRQKSFRAAAIELRQSVNALRRRLDQLESQLGATLLTRHVDGVRLTEEGQRVLAIAERMEVNAFELARAADQNTSQAEGMVTLATTEGLGTFWIAARLNGFMRDNPRIVVDLHCAMLPADVLRMEADVAVQLERPIQKDVKRVKLGRMHLMPYVSPSYAARHGLPKQGPDLSRHPVIVQAAEQLVPVDEYAKTLGGEDRLGPVVMRSNISGTHYFAIATGAGLGLLPTYCSAVGATVIPLDLDFCAHHDIWLVYHPDAARIPRVRKLIDWLIEAFSPQRYPWFADKCVHPRDFPKDAEGGPPADAYAPFIPEKR